MAADYFTSLGFKHLAYVGHGPWAFVRTRLASFAGRRPGKGMRPDTPSDRVTL